MRIPISKGRVSQALGQKSVDTEKHPWYDIVHLELILNDLIWFECVLKFFIFLPLKTIDCYQ